MTVLDELITESRKIIAEGGMPTVRLLAQRVFLSPSTVQAQIGSMEKLLINVARQIGDDLLTSLGEDVPLSDDTLRAAARERLSTGETSIEEGSFAWTQIASSEELVDLRDRAFAFVWPTIDPAHYVHWADSLIAALHPMIKNSRDVSSPGPQIHGAIQASYAEWLTSDEAPPRG